MKNLLFIQCPLSAYLKVLFNDSLALFLCFYLLIILVTLLPHSTRPTPPFGKQLPRKYVYENHPLLRFPFDNDRKDDDDDRAVDLVIHWTGLEKLFAKFSRQPPTTTINGIENFQQQQTIVLKKLCVFAGKCLAFKEHKATHEHIPFVVIAI